MKQVGTRLWPLIFLLLPYTVTSHELPQDGQLTSEEKKSWQASGEDQFVLFEKHPLWITIAIVTAITSILLIATLLWNYSLRERVNKKTVELQNELKRRIKAEKAVSNSEERLNSFFDASFEALFMHDNGKILDINPATTKTFGYEEHELLGHNILEFVSPEYRQKVAAFMAKGEPGPYEITGIKKNGENVPVTVRARTIKTATKTIRVVSLSDISKQKQAEAALQEAYDNLEHLVVMRTKELKEANDRLMELDRLKSMFIASMSHELRTPLNAVIGFTGVILSGMSGDINAKQQDQLERVYNSAKHLLSLITDIIDISKIEAGHIDIYPETFVLSDLVDEALHTIQPQRNEKGLALQTDIPADIQMHTDRKRLLQCILNYLSNAVKYTEHGRIEVTINDLGKEIEIMVRDSGIGIDEEAKHRLFQPFERIDTHLSVKTPGTGLGLYLCKKIVTEILKGSVAVESKAMQGSTFSLKIPKKLN